MQETLGHADLKTTSIYVSLAKTAQRKALDHRGKSNLGDQQELLTQALTLLPEGVRITIHGDSEFRGWPLFSWLRQQGLDAGLGMQGNTYVSTTPTSPGDSFAWWR